MPSSASGCLPCAASPEPASARNSNGCFFVCVRCALWQVCARATQKRLLFSIILIFESPDLPPMRGATAMCQARRSRADLGAGFRHVCRTSPGARSLREKRAAFPPKGGHQLPTTTARNTRSCTMPTSHAHQCSRVRRHPGHRYSCVTATLVLPSRVPSHVPRHARVSACAHTALRFVAHTRHEWLRYCTIRPLPEIHLLDPLTLPLHDWDRA